MLNKFPNSGNIHHAAVPPDVTSFKVVPNSGNNFKKTNEEILNSDAESSGVQVNVRRGHCDANVLCFFTCISILFYGQIVNLESNFVPH